MGRSTNRWWRLLGRRKARIATSGEGDVTGEERAVRGDRRNGSVEITAPVKNRGEQIVSDPAGYFEEARKRASKKVERDLRREHRLNGA
jgi:hypothetical protein